MQAERTKYADNDKSRGKRVCETTGTNVFYREQKNVVIYARSVVMGTDQTGTES